MVRVKGRADMLGLLVSRSFPDSPHPGPLPAGEGGLAGKSQGSPPPALDDREPPREPREDPDPLPDEDPPYGDEEPPYPDEEPPYPEDEPPYPEDGPPYPEDEPPYPDGEPPPYREEDPPYREEPLERPMPLIPERLDRPPNEYLDDPNGNGDGDVDDGVDELLL
jgi:hypothetical protein